jgi:putative addiction module component (TIGR02574 family)
MKMTKEFDYSSLSRAERIALAQALWNSVDAKDKLRFLAVTSKQLEDIDRRIAAGDASVFVGISWTESR